VKYTNYREVLAILAIIGALINIILMLGITVVMIKTNVIPEPFTLLTPTLSMVACIILYSIFEGYTDDVDDDEDQTNP